jgi:hypothetical protein
MEIYDNGPAADSVLANISTRGFVQGADNVMIGGFILGGNPANATIAVRGIGPSLANLGLNNVLADPTLELRNENGVILISSDNWTDDPVAAWQLTDSGLALSDSKGVGYLHFAAAGAIHRHSGRKERWHGHRIGRSL